MTYVLCFVGVTVSFALFMISLSLNAIVKQLSELNRRLYGIDNQLFTVGDKLSGVGKIAYHVEKQLPALHYLYRIAESLVKIQTQQETQSNDVTVKKTKTTKELT